MADIHCFMQKSTIRGPIKHKTLIVVSAARFLSNVIQISDLGLNGTLLSFLD